MKPILLFKVFAEKKQKKNVLLFFLLFLLAVLDCQLIFFLLQDWFRPANASLARLDKVKPVATVYNIGLRDARDLKGSRGKTTPVVTNDQLSDLQTEPPLSTVSYQKAAWLVSVSRFSVLWLPVNPAEGCCRRRQKLWSPLQRTQSYLRFSRAAKLGVGQNIALHVSPNARNSACLISAVAMHSASFLQISSSYNLHAMGTVRWSFTHDSIMSL